MTTEATSNIESALKNESGLSLLIAKQQAQLDTIVAQNKKILRHFFWMSVSTYVRMALITIPLILALIYLPPLLSGVMNQYGQLLNDASGKKTNQSGFTLPNVDLKSLQQLLH